jgi:hypothetical protein
VARGASDPPDGILCDRETDLLPGSPPLPDVDARRAFVQSVMDWLNAEDDPIPGAPRFRTGSRIPATRFWPRR